MQIAFLECFKLVYFPFSQRYILSDCYTYFYISIFSLYTTIYIEWLLYIFYISLFSLYTTINIKWLLSMFYISIFSRYTSIYIEWLLSMFYISIFSRYTTIYIEWLLSMFSVWDMYMYSLAFLFSYSEPRSSVDLALAYWPSGPRFCSPCHYTHPFFLTLPEPLIYN